MSSVPEGVTDPNYKPLPGRVGNLSPQQQAALDQFRKELQEEGKLVPERHDDPTLLRFLRARKFDVPKAKVMIISCEEWRAQFGVDDIVKNFDFKEKEQVDKYYPQYYHKTDKDGRPIYVERLGFLDIKALYAITTKERQLQRLVYEYEKFLNERLPACSKAVGHPVETSCTILDLKGVSLGNYYSVKDYISDASSIGQDRYPETMGKFYVINAPWGFRTIWNFIKGWLDEATVAKIDILGSDYLKTLLEQIPIEHLPKEFGGKCECPGGCSLSDAGPWNPKA
ncbi:CRAL-TRIO domain-containing protein [Earliella scabrosa]|nr:CRAL-TRIO domain-containing protein [Earliella scabrosa]